MNWRIDVGGILKLTYPRIIRRITQAWLPLVVVGSLQPNRLLEVAGFMRRARLRAAIGSLQPASLLVAVGSLRPASPGPVLDLHREIHWLAFGGAALLLLLGSRNRRQEIRSVIAVFLLGLSLEYLQHLIYHNPMEWDDVGDDALAILAVLALYRLAGTCKAACLARHCAATGRRSLAALHPPAPGCNTISPAYLSSAAPTPAGNPLDEPAGS
jgi:hypothetical protein